MRFKGYYLVFEATHFFDDLIGGYFFINADLLERYFLFHEVEGRDEVPYFSLMCSGRSLVPRTTVIDFCGVGTIRALLHDFLAGGG